MDKHLKSQKTLRKEIETDDDFNIISEHGEYTANYTEYTPAGNVKLEKSFDLNNELQEKIEYIFDENETLLKQILYFDEEEVAEERTYEYNESGKLIQVNKHYAEGSFDYTSYFYDTKGLLSEKKKFSQDDELEETEQFEYQDEKLIREARFDQDMKLIYEQKLTQEENFLERTVFDIDDGKSRIAEEYDEQGHKTATLFYDKKDRLVSKNIYEYENEKLKKIIYETASGIETTLFHYNDHGDITLQEEVDSDDFYKSRIRREYGEDNNLILTQVYVNNYGKTADLNYVLTFENEYYN